MLKTKCLFCGSQIQLLPLALSSMLSSFTGLCLCWTLNSPRYQKLPGQVIKSRVNKSFPKHRWRDSRLGLFFNHKPANSREKEATFAILSGVSHRFQAVYVWVPSNILLKHPWLTRKVEKSLLPEERTRELELWEKTNMWLDCCTGKLKGKRKWTHKIFCRRNHKWNKSTTYRLGCSSTGLSFQNTWTAHTTQ